MSSGQAHISIWMSGFRVTEPDEEFQCVWPSRKSELTAAESPLQHVHWRAVVEDLRTAHSLESQYALVQHPGGRIVIRAAAATDRHGRPTVVVVALATRQEDAPADWFSHAMDGFSGPLSFASHVVAGLGSESLKNSLRRVDLEPVDRPHNSLVSRVAAIMLSNPEIGSAVTPAFSRLPGDLLIGTHAEARRAVGRGAPIWAVLDVRSGNVVRLQDDSSTLDLDRRLPEVGVPRAISEALRVAESVVELQGVLSELRKEVASLRGELQDMRRELRGYARDRRKLRL